MILKKIFLAVAVCSSIAEISAKELNVLMIGNSFSVCVGQYLPQIVANAPDNELILTSAFISGCSFEQHYDALIKAEKILNSSLMCFPHGIREEIRSKALNAPGISMN